MCFLLEIIIGSASHMSRTLHSTVLELSDLILNLFCFKKLILQQVSTLEGKKTNHVITCFSSLIEANKSLYSTSFSRVALSFIFYIMM